MRFERIDLTRFGCFTDQVISLGTAAPASGDFHIIYGDNEAGKSTLRTACIHFLYGIPAQTPYNFLHNYQVMEIGAKLTIGSHSYEGKRTKGNKHTLIGVGESPLTQAILGSALGDITREGYEQIYSLDDASLEAGGDAILNSQGDLGTLLFSAMSGLSDISTTLDKIRLDTFSFFKPQGRSYRLSELNKQLKELDEEIKREDKDDSAYMKLKDEANMAERLWEEKKQQRDMQRLRMQQLEALLECHSLWQERSEIQHALTMLKDAPDNVPKAWLNEVTALMQQEVAARSRQESEQEAIVRAETAYHAIVSDEIALSLANPVRRLQQDDLETHYKAAQTLAQEETTLQHLQRQRDAQLQLLGCSHSRNTLDLMLPIGIKAELKAQMQSFPAIENALRTAQRERDMSSRTVDTIEEELTDYPVLAEPHEIIAALAVAKDAPTRKELTALHASLDTATLQCNDAFILCAPWKGTLEELVRLTLTSADTMHDLIAEHRRITEAIRDIQREKEGVLDSLAQHNTLIRSLQKDFHIVTDEEAMALREKRQQAWEAHFQLITQNILPTSAELQRTAHLFMEALQKEEESHASRLACFSEVAQLRQAMIEKNTSAGKLARIEEKIYATEQQHSYHRAIVEDIYAALHLPQQFPITELPLWTERCKRVHTLLRDRLQCEIEYHTAQHCYDEALQQLADATQAYGRKYRKDDLATLMQQAELSITEWKENRQEHKTLQQKLAEANTQFTQREREWEAAKEVHSAWHGVWKSTLARTWLEEQTTPTECDATLDALDALALILENITALESKITLMAQQRDNYCEKVHHLAKTAGVIYDDTNPLLTADALRKRVTAAQEAEQLKISAKKQLSDAQACIAHTHQTLQQLAKHFQHFTGNIPADSLPELHTTLQRAIEKDNYRQRLQVLHKQLTAKMNAETIDACLQRLEEQFNAPDACQHITIDLQNCAESHTQLDAEVSEFYAAWQRHHHDLLAIGKDNLVATKREQRHALLLEIEQQAHRYMRLSAGLLVTHHALQQYRTLHRSSMLKAASQTFTHMTRGVFTELKAVAKDDKELLFGIRHDGSSLLASDMSRGTKFQLYLALRIAGHAELAKNGELLPFFADDILEPFDDKRSSETFSLLHEMSRRGQVVYLTHHRHLCDIAQKVTGGNVSIHELPTR